MSKLLDVTLVIQLTPEGIITSYVMLLFSSTDIVRALLSRFSVFFVRIRASFCFWLTATEPDNVPAITVIVVDLSALDVFFAATSLTVAVPSPETGVILHHPPPPLMVHDVFDVTVIVVSDPAGGTSTADDESERVGSGVQPADIRARYIIDRAIPTLRNNCFNFNDISIFRGLFFSLIPQI